MPCYSILHYFCSFVPSNKKVSFFALCINTSSSFENQLKPILWMKPFLLLPSRAGHPSSVDHHPRSFPCSLPLSLSLLLGARDHRAVAPPGPTWRGNCQESAQWEMNEYLNQWLYFPRIYISNTSSYSVSDKSKSKTL